MNSEILQEINKSELSYDAKFVTRNFAHLIILVMRFMKVDKLSIYNKCERCHCLISRIARE